MDDELTEYEKELALFCAEFAEGGDVIFPDMLELNISYVLANPTLENLKIACKSYAALVLLYAIEKGKQQEEDLTSQLFKGIIK